MIVRNVIRLLEKYENCPDCGNNKIGSGEGNLIVGGSTFIRTCKCGYKIVAIEDVNGKIITNLQ